MPGRRERWGRLEVAVSTEQIYKTLFFGEKYLKHVINLSNNPGKRTYQIMPPTIPRTIVVSDELCVCVCFHWTEGTA